MGIYYIFIVSKSGGLIFNYDHNLPQLENEKVSLDFKKRVSGARFSFIPCKAFL
jgi:hypothetical protein